MGADFRVGQEVVCVNEPMAGFYLEHCPERPKKGCYYIIRALDYYDGGVAVFLHGIKNPMRLWWGGQLSEPGFHSAHFRPVIERKTDISALTALLNPANHKVLEGA